ncbi:cob(I)yrinic acid a,c-diamide adenosyltransferase [Prevotella sp. OH937_COT-195]|uniref:cob(I)yrinic acid a,c-diamide adenosyltransferase n=1 Tax=Prevotella sp. OH937_COT-195 TaxID=2491051 RepID=UPI000F647E06|nr:cob(I)yrinic acid a,c-diamide adenosyltransferase [Prevotella sp. OH937_COT-195]RRC99438.1 cob(I)yrinic acid a,c-diamide adenosyltransferase [Prevotella sp. OH937_COT-195]
MAISKVYTKTGDNGTTSLVGGVKVSKTNPRIEAYGTVDELSAHLGMLASLMKDGEDKDLIIRTQCNLFTVCSYLATDKTKTPLAKTYTISADETTLLEHHIDEINAGIPVQRSFILPGGSHEAALAHVARTVCRRAERRIFLLGETTKLAPEITHYINRLSDYLFVLARKLNFVEGVSDIAWTK